MRHLGYDRKITRLLDSLYQSTKSAVRIGTQNEVSSLFNTRMGVLRGGVLSPLLFIVMLEVAVALAYTDDAGIVVSGSKVSNLQFADELADGQSELQK